MLIAGHWYGICGTYPGTGSGSQCIEALHSTWQREVQHDSRASLLTVLPAMQALYNRWKDIYEWGRPVSFTSFPKELNPALLNSAAYRSCGRSSAVEYWAHRGLPNFIKLARRTGDLQLPGQEAYTEFYVVAAQSSAAGMPAPAERVVSQSTAERIVAMLVSSGAQLEALLQDAGVVQGCKADGTWRVDIAALRSCFGEHAVVYYGHLVHAYWRRVRRGGGATKAYGLCTCACFMQHAECEHYMFAQALRGGPPNLNAVPDVRRCGRKRKAQGAP
jgi:hypothetical protein